MVKLPWRFMFLGKTRQSANGGSRMSECPSSPWVLTEWPYRTQDGPGTSYTPATPFAAESRETLDRSRSLEDAIRVFAEHLPAARGEDPASDA